MSTKSKGSPKKPTKGKSSEKKGIRELSDAELDQAVGGTSQLAVQTLADATKPGLNINLNLADATKNRLREP